MQNDLISEPIGRRSLLRRAALTAVGVGALAAVAGERATAATLPSTISGVGNTQVLNFLLYMSDLEADLYAQAVLRLGAGGTDPNASVSVGAITGLNLSSTAPDVQYITEFSSVAAAHSSYLRSNNVLGSAAMKVQKYAFGINSLNRTQVLDLVIEIEVTLLQSYIGAVGYFTGNNYLQVALAPQGTFARHASLLSAVLNQLIGDGLDTGTAIPVVPSVGVSGPTPSATSFTIATANLGTTDGRDLVLDPNAALALVAQYVKTS